LIRTNSIAATNLIDVPHAWKVAACIINLEIWDRWTGPTFAIILRTAEGILANCAGRDTHWVRVVIIAIKLSFQLASRVILFEASDIPVLTVSIGQQRRSLLCYACAYKRNILLRESKIIDI
jgi:hypothetical protein